MKSVISYSIWGNNPKYTIGAIRNVENALIFYPGWVCRFYYDLTVPKDIICSLGEFDNVELVQKPKIGDWTSMFWRFECVYDGDVDVSIIRDTDSRLSKREKEAVDEWLNSDKTFHIMRDHPYHKFPILGGMWGVKNKNHYLLETIINEYYLMNSKNLYGADYLFFIEKLYPIIKNDCFVHDEFFEKKSFPSSRTNKEFVGMIYNEFDQPAHPEHSKLL